MRFFPYMLRVLTVSTVVLIALIAYTSVAQAQDVLPAKIKTPVTTGAINWDDFPYPVDNTEVSPGGYPIFLIECNQGQCYGETGHPIGTEQAVATQLPAIKAVDARLPTYHCNYVCMDQDQNVVGSNPYKVHPTR